MNFKSGIELLDLADYLKNNRAGCLRVLKICSDTGSAFNSRSDRFIKSEIMDRSYADCLDQMKYVDMIGHDLLFREQHTISSKGQGQVFCKTKKITREIALTNTRDNKKERNQDFNLIIITQTKPPMSIAIATYDAAMKNKKITKDQIVTRIEYGDLQFIIHPSEGVCFPKCETDFKKYKKAFLNSIIKRCLSSAAGEPPTFSEGKSLVAKRASDSERDCDQTSLGW